MFNDGRSKKVVFIAHCFLNQNSISDGTAVCPAIFEDIVEFFVNSHVGIVQMPCPELCCLGLDRGNVYGADSPVVVENTRIRAEMKKSKADKKLTELADYVVQQILEYHKSGFEIVGIIGANRSPNCGVDTTSDNNEEIIGVGLFIEKISYQLSKVNISVPLIGLKKGDNISEKLQHFLNRDLSSGSEKMSSAIYPFPFGQLKIGYEGDAVTLLKRTDEPVRSEGRTPLTDLAFGQITEYLEGRRREFDFPYHLQGTEFQQKVWRALRAIPYGETRTYGEIAAAVGSPKAARAVGMANHHNPVLIAVPCHRVIGADGSLVGYGSGLDMKEALLRLEKRVIQKENLA